MNEFFLGDFNPQLIRIPEGVYHGFKCISDQEALVINLPSETYIYDEPDEIRFIPMIMIFHTIGPEMMAKNLKR